MTFEIAFRLIVLFSLHNDVSDIHVCGSGQQTCTEDDHLTLGQLDEVCEPCGDAVGTRVVE